MNGVSLCGVAIVGRPVARHFDDGETVEITRVCTDGMKNACSALYGACRRVARELGYRRLITYTLPEEGGASLRASGFRFDGDAGGGDWFRKSRSRTHLEHTPEDLVGGKWRWSAALSRGSEEGL